MAGKEDILLTSSPPPPPTQQELAAADAAAPGAQQQQEQRGGGAAARPVATGIEEVRVRVPACAFSKRRFERALQTAVPWRYRGGVQK